MSLYFQRLARLCAPAFRRFAEPQRSERHIDPVAYAAALEILG